MPSQADYQNYGAQLKADISEGLSKGRRLLGVWYTTVPRWLDASSGMSVWVALQCLLRIGGLLLIPAVPYLSKRYLTDNGVPPAFTKHDVIWAAILLVATGYGYWFDRVRRGKSGSALTAKKTAALLLDSAGTISALSSVIAMRAGQTTTSAEYRGHLQRILKRIHTEVGLLLNAREETFGMVTLLLYGNSDGSELQMFARSSDATAPVKTIAAHKLMAHYVAQTGRDWVEHDFRRKSNLFPKVRLTKPGEKAKYRSILFKPILLAVDGASNAPIYCRGVLCIHSDQPYHFWRLGDDSSSGVLLLRLAPYFALLELLLEEWPYKVAIDPTD